MSHAIDIQPIWSESCAVVGCHDGTFVPTLLPGQAYGEIVNVLATGVDDLDYVEPGSADQSYLYRKVTGTQVEVGGGGVQMPLAGTPLSDEQLQRIADWIEQGAAP